MKSINVLTITIVGFLIAFFHSNSYASPNTVEKLPFKILKDDENFFYKVDTLKQHEDIVIDKVDFVDFTTGHFLNSK